jgi:LmbE family N-acetylglucosaminyl deacetylase
MNISAGQDAVVKLRPHYALKGNDVYFLASGRPARHLIDAEAQLVRVLADTPSGMALSALSSEQARHLDALVTHGFADVVARLTSASKHHLVVIEPHMDDAILSVGGQLLLRSGQHRITILSVFGVSNYTSYMEMKRPFFDQQEITRLRVEESRLAAALVGAQFASLGFLDAPLRLLPADEWSVQGLPEQLRMTHGFLGSIPMPHMVRMVADEVSVALQELDPDELWIPMGLGHHVDHRTCRSACLRALLAATGKLGRLPVRLYEDLPYSQPVHRRQLLQAFASAGARLTLQTEDISDVIEQKVHAAGAFASQFKLSAMAPRLRKAASDVAQASGYRQAGEQSYWLDRPFQIPPEIGLALDRDALADLGEAVQRFAARMRRHKHLDILVLPSGIIGSIAEVAAALSSIFPGTAVTINVIGENPRKPGVHRLENGSLKCTGARSWRAKLILARQLSRIGTPTIIVSWGGQQGSFLKRTLLQSLRASRSLLVTPSLTDVCALWEEMKGN